MDVTAMAELLGNLIAGKVKTPRVPRRFIRIALNAIDTALALHNPDEWEDAYEAALADVLARAQAHDIKWLPNKVLGLPVEEPVERFFISLWFETVWAVVTNPRIRAMLERAAAPPQTVG